MYHYESTGSGTTNQKKVTIDSPTSSTPNQVIKDEQSTLGCVGDGCGGSGNTATPSQNVNVTGGNITATLDKSGLATDGKQCGYDAAHPCETKLAEGDTPNSFSSDHGNSLDSLFDSQIANMNGIQNGAGPGLEIGSILNSLPDSGCVDPQLEIPNQSSITLPLCTYNATIQPIAQWVTYIFTAFAIWGLWFRRLGGAK